MKWRPLRSQMKGKYPNVRERERERDLSPKSSNQGTRRIKESFV